MQRAFSLLAVLALVMLGATFALLPSAPVRSDSGQPKLVDDKPVTEALPAHRVETPVTVTAAPPAPPAPPPGSISVAAMQATRRALRRPYDSPRFVTQCRRESRRDTETAETVEVKDEARDRATRLAREGRLDETTIFARIIYGEAGTPQPGRNDNDAIVFLAVIDALRGSRSRVEMMVRFAPRRVFPSGLSEHQSWIAEAQDNGARPASWPAPRGRVHHSYPPWRSYGCPRWLAAVEQARALLHEYRDRRVGRGPCNDVPTTWGGEMDDHRMIRVHATRLECGTMLNHPWRVPGMGS